MEKTELKDEELVELLNLTIKIVSKSAPVFAADISDMLKELYIGRQTAKDKIAALEARVAELENPAVDATILAAPTKEAKTK